MMDGIAHVSNKQLSMVGQGALMSYWMIDIACISWIHRATWKYNWFVFFLVPRPLLLPQQEASRSISSPHNKVSSRSRIKKFYYWVSLILAGPNGLEHGPATMTQFIRNLCYLGILDSLDPSKSKSKAQPILVLAQTPNMDFFMATFFSRHPKISAVPRTITTCQSISDEIFSIGPLARENYFRRNLTLFHQGSRPPVGPNLKSIPDIDLLVCICPIEATILHTFCLWCLSGLFK